MLDLGIVAAIIEDLIRMKGNRKWPIAQGLVVEQNLERIAKHAFTCTVWFTYNVDGGNYFGMRIQTFTRESQAAQFLSAYHKGRSISVRCKPGKPNIYIVRDEDNPGVSQQYA